MGILGYSMTIWHIFSSFGIIYQENLAILLALSNAWTFSITKTFLSIG
jgi:hypothetical protein